jgi:hypothetical protein
MWFDHVAAAVAANLTEVISGPLSVSRKMPEKYPEMGHNHLLPNSYHSWSEYLSQR